MTLIKELLVDHHLILASGSPRRQNFLKQLDIPFKIRVKEVEETYPSHLEHKEISEFLARKKASAFLEEMEDSDLLITADTIVWHQGNALGKPMDREQAVSMLTSLSDNSHDVITSVCLTTKKKQLVFSDMTKVEFAKLDSSEIEYYVDHYEPYDKAGAYGIQEWIGFIGVRSISGSYFNVVGFPVQKFYRELRSFLLELNS